MMNIGIWLIAGLLCFLILEKIFSEEEKIKEQEDKIKEKEERIPRKNKKVLF